MDILLNRYRNITVLMLVLGAQLFLLAWQVRTRHDVQLLRVWSTSAFIPLAHLFDGIRNNTVGVLTNYADLMRVRDDNRKLQDQVNNLKLQNQHLRTELATADRARALALFLQKDPNRYVAARIVGTAPGAGTKVVLVDRGTKDGVRKGMAVLTPDGIAGKVTAAYPSGSQVLLVTDSTFAAGVISQKHRVHGILRGQGHNTCTVEYVQNEDSLEVGEWLYTSGNDRVFPKGLPVGQVKLVRPGKMFFKEVFVTPSGLQQGLEEVLIVVEGVHQPIPDLPDPSQPLHLLAPPPPETSTTTGPGRVIRGAMTTEADQVMERYTGPRPPGTAKPSTHGTATPAAPAAARPVTGTTPAPSALTSRTLPEQ